MELSTATTNSDGDILFEFSLPIEEDIDAVLAHFTALVRLGADDAARDIADTILWRHLYFFPVFAELGAFYVATDDQQAVKEMLHDVSTESTHLYDASEGVVSETLKMFAANTLTAATVRALKAWGSDKTKIARSEIDDPMKSEIEFDMVPSDKDVPVATFKYLNDIDYKDKAMLAAVEMSLLNLLHRTAKRSKTDAEDVRAFEEITIVQDFTSRHLEKLQEAGHNLERTQMLHFICGYAARNNKAEPTLLTILQSQHQDIITKTAEQIHAVDADPREVKINNLLTKLSAKEALYLAIQYSNRVAIPKDDEYLQQQAQDMEKELKAMVCELNSEIGGLEAPEDEMAFLRKKWTARGMRQYEYYGEWMLPNQC